MVAARGARILNDATSQLDRDRGAPAPERVDVDGRSLAQLLAFAADYGELIRFYDLNDQPVGDWSSFFAADPVIGYAMQLAIDPGAVELALRDLIRSAHAAREPAARLRLIRRILAALVRLLAILEGEWPGGGDAEARLRSHRRQHNRPELDRCLSAVQRHLALNSVEAGIGPGPDAWGRRLLDLIETVVDAVLAAIERERDAASEKLILSLQSGDHAPQAALYNAFAILFAEQRATLNRFPRRFVEFYYGDIIDQHGLAAHPDTLFLTFTRAKDAEQASVPHGALFSAGTDAEGAAINYAAQSALEVTAARVTRLSVHRVTHLHQAHSSDPLVPTGVLSGDVALPGGTAPRAPFPLFGANQAGTYGALTLTRATLGFCLASATLMLGGGARTITIALAVSRRSGPLAALSRAADGDREAPSDGMMAAQRLASAIEESFHLHYSTAGGWMAVDGFTVTPSALPGSDSAFLFSIRFELPPDAPPLVAVSTPPTKGAPPPTHPASAFPKVPDQPAVLGGLNLSGAAESAAFAILSTIEIDAVSLDVSVAGFDRLSLATPNGPVDPQQNFAILGLPPVQYAALEIAAPELFAKAMDRVAVNIAWAGLPVTSTGFKGYYQGYVLDADGAVASDPLFDNGCFQVAFALANPGRWTVAGTAQPLFRTVAATGGGGTGPAQPPAAVADAPLARGSRLELPGVVPATPPAYYSAATTHLRLTLVAPDYAFGNVLYSSNLMAASAAQSSAARAAARRGPHGPPPPPPPPLPNPPWLPMASGITVDYSASAQLDLRSGMARATPAATGATAPIEIEFWHVDPFAALTPPVGPDSGTAGLLPRLDAHAALYIDLSVPVDQVALLFILQAGPDGWWDDPPAMVWEQRIADDWVPATLLGDGTEGLRNSGIVRLQLRTDPQSGHPRLRVRARGVADKAPIVQAVIANAVSASWVGPGGAAGLGRPLPIGSIAKAVAPLPGIASIDQPMESFGGRPPATGRAFQTWMAERLRHKGYGIDAWDYARLALAAVPSLWQIAVVPAIDANSGARDPGAVWLVAVAGPETPNITDPTIPSIDLATLAEIGETIEAVISPFVRLTVTNPPYLRLKVSAQLSFSDGNTGAYWIERLQAELVKWLSPWPDPAIGPRPARYYTRRAVSEFIRGRPYVRGIDRLDIAPETSPPRGGWVYLTSALQHDLTAASALPGASRTLVPARAAT